jgi:mannose/cellobiose epimerase-like protein (N-acyl-D-glucosamine 2-epimerase family)
VADKVPSDRAIVANRVAELVRAWGLCEVFGGDAERSPDGRYYYVLFSRRSVLDGLVRVYGPAYVLVRYAGAHGEGTRVYDSDDKATDFIRLAFVEHKMDEALAIPEKSRLRRIKHE